MFINRIICNKFVNKICEYSVVLQPVGIVKRVDWSMDIMPFVNTVQFFSDGIYFYWVWMATMVSERSASSAAVYLDVFRLEVCDNVQMERGITLLNGKMLIFQMEFML